MQDVIFIEQIPVMTVIGIHEYEKAAPQRLLLSFDFGVDISQAAERDKVDYALDYTEVTRFVVQFAARTKVELIETFAEQLIASLFAEFAVQTIKLRLQKPGAIVETQQVGLVITRERP